jgi:hypothetical protein
MKKRGQLQTILANSALRRIENMKNFLIATAAVFIVTHANAGGYYNPKTGNYEMPPPKTTMEKNIPSDFFGEWCYVGDNGKWGDQLSTTKLV